MTSYVCSRLILFHQTESERHAKEKKGLQELHASELQRAQAELAAALEVDLLCSF